LSEITAAGTLVMQRRVSPEELILRLMRCRATTQDSGVTASYGRRSMITQL